MSPCGCKKKHQVPPQVAQPAKVTLTESVPPKPPQPIQAPEPHMDQIVEKLEKIITPQENN
jgi:hypothetical protein